MTRILLPVAFVLGLAAPALASMPTTGLPNLTFPSDPAPQTTRDCGQLPTGAPGCQPGR